MCESLHIFGTIPDESDVLKMFANVHISHIENVRTGRVSSRTAKTMISGNSMTSAVFMLSNLGEAVPKILFRNK